MSLLLAFPWFLAFLLLTNSDEFWLFVLEVGSRWRWHCVRENNQTTGRPQCHVYQIGFQAALAIERKFLSWRCFCSVIVIVQSRETEEYEKFRNWRKQKLFQLRVRPEEVLFSLPSWLPSLHLWASIKTHVSISSGCSRLSTTNERINSANQRHFNNQ